jgi:opacity protein-like surface antigen
MPRRTMPVTKRAVTAASLSIIFASHVLAADVTVPSASFVPSGFFAGLGASYSAVRLEQEGYGIGLTEIFDGEIPVAVGRAVGPTPPFRETDDRLGFDAQAGYLDVLTDTGDWLWGMKLGYKYLGAELTDRDIDSPQTGTYIQFLPEPEEGTLTGNAVLKSVQTEVDSEVLFVPFLGHSFSNSYIYAGAGPAVFKTRSKINDLVGLADIDGHRFDLTGTPMDFSGSQWMWGGAVQAGFTYFLSESWFVDVNYTYARSKKYEQKYSAPFTNVVDGLTYSGTVELEVDDKITSQGVSITINTLF